jgi:hypothetical protein
MKIMYHVHTDRQILETSLKKLTSIQKPVKNSAQNTNAREVTDDPPGLSGAGVPHSRMLPCRYLCGVYPDQDGGGAVNFHRYVFLWGWCGFYWRKYPNMNTASRLVFNWVLSLGIVSIRCMKNEAEQTIAIDQILSEVPR